uniref:Uncharacterized protein n=1 Tax=Romanomermis culicivorax TaxID=13658 RepID=A0A915I3Q7_ROMCU
GEECREKLSDNLNPSSESSSSSAPLESESDTIDKVMEQVHILEKVVLKKKRMYPPQFHPCPL